MLLTRSSAMLVGALALGCSSDVLDPAPQLAPNQTLTVDATVRFLSTVEGGCWGLATPRGLYEPVDLASGFRVDGRKVRVVLRDAHGWASICMIGGLVHVDSIRTR
jgi:hypothetical protein